MRSDAELLRAARTDPAAFRELYDRYAEQIHRFAYRRTGDADAAHDLTAETFAQAWLSRRRFRDRAGGIAGPWLYGVARNVIRQSVRRRRLELAACAKLGLLERLDEPHATVEPTDDWLVELDELPPGERDAVELRVVHDLSYDEVAARLSTTPGAARVRVARGLGRLRERFIRDQREAV
jgi:RNA polymerase sigma-70 factor (ECF subfamily)